MKRVDVAIAVIAKGNQILICQRRAGDVFGGYWEFPGGKCEPEEAPEVCLARELMEELAIEAQLVRKLATIRHDYPEFQVTLHPYLCEARGGEPKAIACQQAKWVEAHQLSAYQFPPANDSLLRELAGMFGAGRRQ